MADAKWQEALERKWGLPLYEIPGIVYSICYDPPFQAEGVSADYAGFPPERGKRGWKAATPIRHYVGWTQQDPPRKRIREHHPKDTPATITTEVGTLEDEKRKKETGTCPRCGGRYAESLAPVRPKPKPR